MDIDLAALRALERERGISLDVLIPAIEQALVLAYQRTEGHFRHSRAELDRKTGHVVIWAREENEVPPAEGEVDDEGNPARPRRELGPEFDDTPTGFGRVAAATARQVIVQRLRDIEDDAILGDFKGREGDIVAGIIQQSPDPRHVTVDFGTVEGILPLAEQVPGESYVHGQRLRCFVVSVKRGMRGPQIGLSRTHPNLVKKLFALEVPEIADGSVQIEALAREAGHRTKIAVHSTVPGLNAKGCVHRPDGCPGARRHERAARREDRHRRLVRRPGDVHRGRALAGPGVLGRDRRPPAALGPGRRARLPAVAGHRPRGPERPAGGQAHRLADRHPPGHRRGRRRRRHAPMTRPGARRR